MRKNSRPPRTTPSSPCLEAIASVDPQLPVDIKEVSWTEMKVSATSHVVYVLSVGSEVTEQTLETTKGKFDLSPGVEQWFSATASVGSVSSAESLSWGTQVFDTESSGAIDDLVDAIEASSGLASSSSDASPAAEGPVGSVVWKADSLPSGLSSFTWTDPAGDKWNLSLSQDASNALSRVYWSTNKEDESMQTTGATVPNAFRGSVSLAAVESPDVVVIYDGYTYP
ncbi:MAG: hypothetical protein R3B72_26375 [Polyangiaceae bacterium]